LQLAVRCKNKHSVYTGDMDLIDEIVARVGTQRKLAEACGLTTGMAISQWKRRGIPARHCRTIERLLAGTDKPLTRYDLRPDIFGRGIRR